MEECVKILVVGTPRLLREVVVEILTDAPEIDVVGGVTELLEPGGRSKLLALTGESEAGVLCELRARRISVGELSAADLRAAISREDGPG
jgi:hypothetical protein